MVMESLVLEKPAPGIELAVGLRTYLEIVKVEAPSDASYGTTVNINIYVKNKWTSRIFAIVTGAYDTAEVTSTSHYIEPGAQRVFGLSFTMPNKSVNVWIWAWYWTADGWCTSPDDEYGPVTITLSKWTLLASKTLTVKHALPPVVGWTLLASKTLTVKVSAVPPPPVGWSLLASKTLTVKPTAAPPVGWSLLDSKTLGITAGPLPTKWELQYHYIDPWAYFYEGVAEQAIAEYTLPPEQFPFTDDMAMKLTNALKDKLLEEAPGARLLEVELYCDQAGPLWSNWLIKVTASVPKEAGTIGYVIPWPLIIKGAIIIAILVLIYFIVKTVTEAWFRPKTLSEDVKKQWSKETLTSMITDLRPEYSAEELTSKTDQELRDILDKVYQEEAAARGGWPWYAWLGITGIAIGGSLVAVAAIRAFAPAKKEEKPREKK